DGLHATAEELALDVLQTRIGRGAGDEHRLAPLHRALQLRVALEVHHVVPNGRGLVRGDQPHGPPPAPGEKARPAVQPERRPALAAQGRASPAPPLGAWTPVPELPGMGRPVDTASVAARRRALLARIGRGVVLVPAAHERELERDYVQDNDFRQSNTFFYLTELETQDAWLLLVAGGGAPETVLFLPPRNPLQERWTG